MITVVFSNFNPSYCFYVLRWKKTLSYINVVLDYNGYGWGADNFRSESFGYSCYVLGANQFFGRLKATILDVHVWDLTHHDHKRPFRLN